MIFCSFADSTFLSELGGLFFLAAQDARKHGEKVTFSSGSIMPNTELS